MIGYSELGTGTHGVIVLNDWLCDTSTWDDARVYLDTHRYRWIFADLRGYGRSRHLAGEYHAAEAAADVLALADALGVHTFSLIGHSMSTMVVLQILREQPQRLRAVVIVTPPPPTGMQLSDTVLAYLRGMALADDAGRLDAMLRNGGTRLSPQWMAFKIARWRASSEPAAVAAYVAMYAGTQDAAPRIDLPALIITGECDAEPMRSTAVASAYGPLCAQLTLVPMAETGHYPMQEAPPLFTSHVLRFLGAA